MGSAVTAEHLKEVLERLSDGIVLFSREGRSLYLNPEATRILGKTSTELVGKHLRETVPEPLYTASEAALQHLSAGEEKLLLASFFAQGRWYEVLGRPSGESFLVHFRDITERLQAEAAQRQSEERFRILVTGIRDYAIVMLDPKGQVASWNVGAERLTGYAAGEILGKHLSFLFPPDLVARGAPRQRLEAAVERGSVASEGGMIRKDGSHILVRSTYTCLFDALGVPRGFAIVTHDITRQRHFEEALRTDQERLRLCMEAAALGTWEQVVGESQFIANAQFVAICGMPPTHQPTYEEFLSIIHPDDLEYFQRKRDEALAVPGGSEFEFEYRVGGGTAKTRWVECHGRVLEPGSESGRRRIIGVIRDTTKRHEADEFRRLSAGVIAHDLRSPLTAIKLSSQSLLRSSHALPQGATEKLQRIANTADRIAHMSQQLLLYAEAQFGGGPPLVRTVTDLERVARHAIGDTEAAHPDCDIHLSAEGDCRGLWDGDALTEVVSNLIENAYKHGERGKPIDVTVQDEGDQVTLSVHNVGLPIHSDLIPMLFEPFKRRKSEQRATGVSFGLGLYIVKAIVSAHGGSVDVDSTQAAGTTFTVRLPRGAGAPSAREGHVHSFGAGDSPAPSSS